MSTSTRDARTKAAARVVGNALKTAHITLTVTKFVDVLTSEDPRNQRNTECDMTPEKRPATVTKLAAAPGKAQTLQVRGGGATFAFWVKSKDRKYSYYPIGIAFRRRNNRGPDNDKNDTLGRRNFSFASMHLWGRTLYITDSFRDCGQGDRYKFSIIIQRQQDGAIGIIDPSIVHVI